MTPLARAVEAANDVILRGDGKHAVAHGAVLAALEVLGPVIVERAQRDAWAAFSRGDTQLETWPDIRASLTEREP